MKSVRVDHSELEALLEKSDFSVGQERNDFLLPQIVDFVRRDQWINTQPEYQRRLVWDIRKKSRLIESLFMNVPIPPIFLYEHDLNRYEVMDGQQRLNTIIEFYENRFELKGLEYGSALNNYSYGALPPRVQRGLDRRRVTATVLLAEKGSTYESMSEIRRQVFDRLNTGGEKLVPQELRNCLYSGPFNELLIELAGLSRFNDLWGIPRYKDNIRAGVVSDRLAKNSLFKRMGDVEIVLRYFAFKGQKSKIKGAVKKILDESMRDLMPSSSADVEKMKLDFTRDLETAYEIFGDDAFVPPDGKSPSQPYFDAIMVSLSRLESKQDVLVQRRSKLRRKVNALVRESEENRELFIGRANTAQAIRQRLDKMEAAFRDVL